MQLRWTRANKPLAAALLLAGIGGQGVAADLIPPLAEIADMSQGAFLSRTERDRARIAAVTATPTDFETAQAFEANPGGAATVARSADDMVFRQFSPGLPLESDLDMRLGEALFDKLWVSSPSSTQASDGLGPLYNARACARCHPRDGRGHPPAAKNAGFDGLKTSMFLKLSVPARAKDAPTALEAYLLGLDGEEATPRSRPAGAYGMQLQDRAVAGHAPEAKWAVTYEEFEVPLSGGERASLRHPHYEIGESRFGPLPKDLQVSPRVANPMIGLGLLEAIPAADILALADPGDADGDGISGRANIGWSERTQAPMLGRFGWKAANPTVEQQSAAAFSGDIGISSPLYASAAGDCTAAQHDCLAGPHGDQDVRGFEIDETGLGLVTRYARHLGVPARVNVSDPQVLRGKEIFHQAGCAACHQPNFVTARRDTEVNPEEAPLSFQLIWPYTDLLLHDMGPGLADHRPEGRASGSEWRTAPLWGIGLTAQVSGHTQFLHDGRARSLTEAILWHGGEAQSARDAVVALPPEDRAALTRFLESL